MQTDSTLTPGEVRRLFTYDPETGEADGFSVEFDFKAEKERWWRDLNDARSFDEARHA